MEVIEKIINNLPGQLGVQCSYKLNGRHSFLEGKNVGNELKLWVKLQSTVDNILRYFNLLAGKNNFTSFLNGHIYAEGLAANKSISGSLEFRLLDEQKIKYSLDFIGDDSQEYYFKGQAAWSALQHIKSILTIHGAIYQKDSGKMISDCTLNFDTNDLLSLLKSYKLLDSTL